MNFLKQLYQCTNVVGLKKILVPENINDILKNLDTVFSVCISDGILNVVGHLIDCGMFKSDELKAIIINAIEYCEKNSIPSNQLLTLYGNVIEYNKNDLKQIFKIIFFYRIQKQMLPTKTKVWEIIGYMYGADEDKKKGLLIEISVLYSNFIEKWGIQPSIDDILDLISIECPMERLTEIFEEKPMNIIKPSIEKEINELVDDYFSDDMQFAGSGSYSIVFKKDGKVVKVSFAGEQYNSYECEQILGFESTKTINIKGMTISLGTQKLANIEWYKGLSEESINLKMYEVFCSAMECGYIICDIKRTNFGDVDGLLRYIDIGHIYTESEFDINKLKQATFYKKVEFFIKLYQEGYRVNSIGQLEINGTLANSNILCNEDLNRQGIRDVMSMSERS